MVTTVSSRLAGGQLDDLLERVDAGDEVILETEGRPRAALIGASVYDELTQLRQEAQRRAAGERLAALREQIVARNQDLSPEQADEIARRAVREAIESLEAEGKLIFERRRG